jgi:hypothetical protein
MLVSCVAYSSTLKMEDVPLKLELIFSGLHNVISQEMELFLLKLYRVNKEEIRRMGQQNCDSS